MAYSRKRCVYHFTSPARLPGCPLVIDPTGLYFRPEGDGFLCGLAPPEAEDPECFDFDVPLEAFEEQLWPLLAHRVPGFERDLLTRCDDAQLIATDSSVRNRNHLTQTYTIVSVKGGEGGTKRETRQSCLHVVEIEHLFHLVLLAIACCNQQ